MPKADKQITVRDFRLTAFDAPIGVFLPNRLDWVVTDVSDENLCDIDGTEVHLFRHWTVPNVYVRIAPPKEE